MTSGARCSVQFYREAGVEVREAGEVVGLAYSDNCCAGRDLSVAVRLDCDFGVIRLFHFSKVSVTEGESYPVNSILNKIQPTL